ncbi:MAG: TRAP transporter large permease [Tropicimonas sp.]|uniref:TRAP transporter large permease n=1 Tax=Tropicimonas sp. TaxID=2067044 RepID=UPI003A879981
MTILIVIFAIFLLCALGVPIAVSIAVVALVGMLLDTGLLALYNAALAIYSGAVSFPLIAIPLFILAGALMNTSGISRRIINFTSALVGFVRGGLAMVNVVASMFFAEISGSAVADSAALGSILIPEMKKRGYKAAFAAAVTSSSASLAIIIPPSLTMILYGAVAETSIVRLFVAGVVPGLLGGFMMMGVCYWVALRHNLPRDGAFSLRRLRDAFRDAFWALTLPVIILGGIFGGFVTATEGAALAVLAALIIGFGIYRELDWRLLVESLREGIMQTAVVMLLVAASAVLGLYLTEAKIPQQMTEQILSLTDNRWLVLALLNILLLLIGMFLHGAAAIILVVPIVLPLVRELGIDPIQFGIMLTLNLALGQQTPPVASVLATTCSIAKTDMLTVTRANLPFIAVLFIVLILVTYVPAVPLSLVRLVYGG